jgi:radical SAM-linked protein
MTAIGNTRVRFRFTKLGKIRWTSHRDVARMWERALRRVALPVAYSEGFTPRPKVSFGLALPTGHESVAEYLDLELEAEPAVVAADVAGFPGRLSAALPVGVDVVAAGVVDAKAGSLQQEVTSSTWEVEGVGVALDELSVLVERALAAPSLVITRQRKGVDVTDDVRPGIISVVVAGPSPCVAEGYDSHVLGAVLACELGTQPRGLRPAEMLRAIDPGLSEGHVRRINQWIERDGARGEPLPRGATDAPHAMERAS